MDHEVHICEECKETNFSKEKQLSKVTWSWDNKIRKKTWRSKLQKGRKGSGVRENSIKDY